MTALKRCPLCLLEKELCVSHIIPAFAGRYLKETSATGYLRDGKSPNIRRQDTAKQPLLCNDCEQIFSSSEREFSLKAFPIIQRDDYREFEYGPWLLKFAVSLSWRILVINQEEVGKDFPQFRRQIAEALENWRLFLLGERKQPGGEHHLFVMAGIPESMPKDVHRQTLNYLLRGIDATEFVTGRSIGIYAKVLRSMFYSPIVPASPTGWKNTRIHSGLGRLTSPQVLAMPGFMEFVEARLDEVHSNKMSEAQRRKVSETMLKNPERALASESFKVHQATVRLLGERPTKIVFKEPEAEPK
jgi:hypothetical protein